LKFHIITNLGCIGCTSKVLLHIRTGKNQVLAITPGVCFAVDAHDLTEDLQRNCGFFWLLSIVGVLISIKTYSSCWRVVNKKAILIFDARAPVPILGIA